MVGLPDRTRVVANGGGYPDGEEAAAAASWGRESCPVCRDPEAAGRRHAVLLESFRDWHGDAERKVAASALPDGWRVLVCGDGPARGPFLEWTTSSRLAGRVVPLGQLPAHAVQHVLADHADLGFALYPPLEGFYFSPLKLFDFLAHGVPVVGTGRGAGGPDRTPGADRLARRAGRPRGAAPDGEGGLPPLRATTGARRSAGGPAEPLRLDRRRRRLRGGPRRGPHSP